MRNGNALERPERLERENRRLRLMMVLVVATVGMLVWPGMSQQRHKTIQAETFQLVDEAGVVRATLTLADGIPHVQAFDKSGKLQVQFSVSEAAPKPLLVERDRGVTRAPTQADFERIYQMVKQRLEAEGRLVTYGMRLLGDKTDAPSPTTK
ncbi:MAG: hypothetical protein FJ279_30955 [Planctomycetes bacterium]|nr:hypothetical protein [Planctomycetota bacterium]MBM4079804.1 hypothetical protein [Planctomycetota bacterium]